jgi:hypothetical protein
MIELIFFIFYFMLVQSISFHQSFHAITRSTACLKNLLRHAENAIVVFPPRFSNVESQRSFMDKPSTKADQSPLLVFVFLANFMLQDTRLPIYEV